MDAKLKPIIPPDGHSADIRSSDWFGSVTLAFRLGEKLPNKP